MFEENCQIYTQVRVQDESSVHMFKAYEQYTVYSDAEHGKYVVGDNGIAYPIDVVGYMFNYVQ